MAVDQATLDRMKAVKSALEAAVTAALPLADSDAAFREQMTELERLAQASETSEYFNKYRALGDTSHRRNMADNDFKHALSVLGVDPNSDYGVSVVLAAAQTANLVVVVSRLLGITPEEVWQNYLLTDDSTEEIIS